MTDLRVRRSPLVAALARIVAAAEWTGAPPGLAEVIAQAGQALACRDDEYSSTVLVVGFSWDDSNEWRVRNQRDDGAQCIVITHPAEIRSHTPPLSVVVLPAAPDRDDWHEFAAAIACLGGGADVIRVKK